MCNTSLQNPEQRVTTLIVLRSATPIKKTGTDFAPVKEIFTFEDKSRAGDEAGETSTANVIENYAFPEAIYNIIGYRVGTDLANSPKPPWLLDLEAGVTDSQSSMAEAGGSRGPGAYSYWNSPSDYTSWTYDRGGGSSSHRKDPYYYSQHSGAGRQQGPYGNQLHTLPPLSLPRDIDAQSPVTTSPSTIGDPLSGGRYPYGSMGSRSQYGDVGRSPPTSTSPYDSQSGASSVIIPRGGELDGLVTPAIAGGQNGHVTLPPLPDPAPSQHSDWKDRSVYPEPSKYAQASYSSQSSRSGLPPLSNLPSLGSVASQTSGYGLPVSSTAPGWAASSYGSNWFEQRSLPTFQPTAFEARGRAYDGSQVPLTINGPLAMGEPMAWHSIYMWRERYPFLEQIAANPGVSVFHIDVYFSLPADWGVQMSEMSVDLTLRPPGNETTGWSLVTDSSFLHPSGHVRYPRNATELRLNDSGELVGSAPTSEMGRLYNYLLADQGRDIETLASIGSPNSAMLQAVMRDTSVSIPPHHVGLPPLGADWNLASTLIIYTFWSPDPDPSRQGLPPQCRPVEFAPPPPLPPVDIGSDPLVAGLLAGEDTQPSKFDWMGTG